MFEFHLISDMLLRIDKPQILFEPFFSCRDRVLSSTYNFLFLVAFNVKTMDVNGSPKILRRECLTKIGPVSKDWFIDAEIMIKAKHLKLKVGEVAVEFLHREQGRSHVEFTTILEFAKNMFNYKLGRGITEWRQRAQKS